MNTSPDNSKSDASRPDVWRGQAVDRMAFTSALGLALFHLTICAFLIYGMYPDKWTSWLAVLLPIPLVGFVLAMDDLRFIRAIRQGRETAVLSPWTWAARVLMAVGAAVAVSLMQNEYGFGTAFVMVGFWWMQKRTLEKRRATMAAVESNISK